MKFSDCYMLTGGGGASMLLFYFTYFRKKCQLCSHEILLVLTREIGKQSHINRNWINHYTKYTKEQGHLHSGSLAEV